MGLVVISVSVLVSQSAVGEGTKGSKRGKAAARVPPKPDGREKGEGQSREGRQMQLYKKKHEPTQGKHTKLIIMITLKILIIPSSPCMTLCTAVLLYVD